MNAKRDISALLLFASLALSALPAGAVSFNTVLNASRNNTAGATTTVGPPNATTYCYLSNVSVTDTDSDAESARCQVRRSGTVWILEAILGRSSDADVSCSATCYNN